MLYDAHCHLQDSRLRPWLPEVVEALQSTGVGRVVVNGTREADWGAVLELAARFDWIIPALGLHPWYLRERSSEWLATLEKAAPQGIGEIGLDRWMPDHDSSDQEEVFQAQLALAAKLGVPVSIHCLKAWGRLREILSSGPLPRAGFLLHSYGGPAEMIDAFVELGGYFSISGYFAHPRKARQREVFRRVPLERFLIETDAPDMQMPRDLAEFGGEEEGINHPANLRAIYRFAAELRGRSFESLAAAVEENFNRLFKPASGASASVGR